MLPFEVSYRDPASCARAGDLTTPHGVVQTPAFMPVGTAGTVKALPGWELERIGPEMVLANTYHLMLRPGVDVLERLGGVHAFMAWNGPILTDSGGYQVYSLASRRRVDDEGVTFRSHLDGNAHRMTPASAVELQVRFGVDVAMVLDECVGYPAERRELETAVERSLDWARTCLAEADRWRRDRGWAGGLFAIQQGGLDPALRQRSIEGLTGAPFDGYAIGGLAVGEPSTALHEGIAMAAEMLPEDRPRYLMGVGYPEDLLVAVERGVDLFDCVLPTRSARTGKVFTSRGDLVIKHARFREDPRPLDPACGCPTCTLYSRGALRHLFVAGEATSMVLLTMHNLFYFVSLMRSAREAIMSSRYGEFRARVVSNRAAPCEDTPEAWKEFDHG